MSLDLSSFDTARAVAFYAATLGVPAEDVTILPPGQGVDQARRVRVRIESSTAEREAQAIDREVEELLVICGRDESHAKGGIEWPEQGLRLARDNDRNPAYFAFAGRVVRETPWSLHLLFVRPKARRVGTAQRSG